MKNKIFELSWTQYDACCSHLLYHENKTEKDFIEDVKSMIKKYGDEYIEQEDDWVGMMGLFDYITPKFQELGYKIIKPIRFNSWGGSIIKKNDKDEDFARLIGKKLFNKACSENKKKEYDLHKKMKGLR